MPHNLHLHMLNIPDFLHKFAKQGITHNNTATNCSNRWPAWASSLQVFLSSMSCCPSSCCFSHYLPSLAASSRASPDCSSLLPPLAAFSLCLLLLSPPAALSLSLCLPHPPHRLHLLLLSANSFWFLLIVVYPFLSVLSSFLPSLSQHTSSWQWANFQPPLSWVEPAAVGFVYQPLRHSLSEIFTSHVPINLPCDLREPFHPASLCIFRKRLLSSW